MIMFMGCPTEYCIQEVIRHAVSHFHVRDTVDNERQYRIDLNFGGAKLWRIDSISPNLTLQFLSMRTAELSSESQFAKF